MLLGHRLQKGDIWRSCQTKDAPIKAWMVSETEVATHKPYAHFVLHFPRLMQLRSSDGSVGLILGICYRG